ncbi:M28 family peptidase [Brumimicrobium oceani]|uniref:Peptidase M28 n=1 Tax=Brumimicrobium oceani TaxID=2100725 RepID=A0A2U2XBD4_9FLAO|nr:M28 family peptidase [Brumimicrobium oceani]PWH85077.1 peptidase M28 [Brumimicrobium oceani]
MGKKIIFLVLFLGHTVVYAQKLENNLKKHIEILASDSLQGRLTGTIGEEMASEYIQNQFKELNLSPLPNFNFIHSFSFTYNLNPHSNPTNTDTIIGKNVVAFLDNGATNTFVIGGHYDHLGHNEYKLSRDTNSTGLIHNGADDNASGVSMVLELARNYSQNNTIEPVNFIFACFSGEELGLMGSKEISKIIKQEYPNTSLMVNFDMVGRMDASNNLSIGGVGTSPSFASVLNKNKPNEINTKLDSSGVGPSDHSSFYYQDIPVLFFFTGLHSDYHKPTDDTEKINLSKMGMIFSYTKSVIDSLAINPNLTFTPTKLKKETKTPSFKVTLGIFPDYKDYGDGLHIQDVIEGKVAQKNGLQKGDIITKIGNVEITDIYTYMEALSKLKKNKKYKTIYIRNGIRKTITIKL